MAIKTADISPEDSVQEQLETWIYESETTFINSSQEAVARFVRFLMPHSSIVDLGCGDGAATQFFHAAGMTVVGVDINQAKLDRNPTRTVRTTMDSYLTRCREVPNIFIHHALEHVPNPKHILALIARKLVPGGLLYVEVPAEDHIHSVHHAAFESPEDLVPEGFEVLEQNTGAGEHYIIARRPYA